MDSDDERAYEPIDERADLNQDIAMEVAWNPIDSNVPLSPMLRVRAACSSATVAPILHIGFLSKIGSAYHSYIEFPISWFFSHVIPKCEHGTYWFSPFG